MGIVYNMNPSY